MKVLREGIRSYPEDPTRYFEFARFEKSKGDFILCEGYFDFTILHGLRNRRVVYLEFDEPNRFFSPDPQFNHIQYEDCLYKVFTICPYTADWLNRMHENKRTAVFFPFNERYVPSKSSKLYDVVYTGHIVSGRILDVIRIISKFNYRFVSHSKHPYVTDHSAVYSEKLDLISKSKITIVHNLLYPNGSHISNLKKVEGWDNNEAFSAIPRVGRFWDRLSRREILVPHLKSRLFEAAFCRSLILCRRDPWNVVERFFRPEREFVYYEPGNLEGSIQRGSERLWFV